MSPKGPPFNFFKNFLQPAGVSQSPKGPPFKFRALDMAPTLAVLGLFVYQFVMEQTLDVSRFEVNWITLTFVQ